MELFETNFTSIDWVIVAVYLGGSILIGLWANRYVGGLSDYLVAGRTLRIRLALATMTGTELGLVTVMYVAELGYTKQFASLYLAVIEVLGLAVIGLTGLVVYRLRQEAVLTVPEYYERRYTQSVRVVGAVMMVLAGVLNMGVFLKAGSLFLVGVTGLEDPMALKLIMTGLLLLVLFYTVLGGMVSVVITDLVQFLVLGVGSLVVSGFVLSEMGGIDGLWELSGTTYIDPLMADNPVTEAAGDGVGPWMLTAQWVTLSIAVMLWPATVSRTLAVKSPTVARRLYLFSTIPFLARRTLPALWGIGAFAFFAFHADLGSEFQDQVDSKNLSTLSAMPLYLAKIIPTGLLGIVTAAMLAAFMSTHDSYLLCWSGVVAQDIVAPLCGGLSDRQRVLVTRVSIVAIGAFLLFWGLWYEVGQELWDYLAITGTVYLSGALPVIVGGLYWKRASSTGALAALACGLMGVCGLSQVIEFINDRLFPDPAGFQVFPAMMMLVTMITPTLVFIPVSLLVPDRQRPDGEQST
ncbi:MAG: solute:Na+ symporter, SSS family protein [Planctomycetaceae bacterium]|nr:sodium:solute symporter family protein [Planctomycetales bacterium]GIS62492.1 MAG: solute:Na+ symporter, SSS family protein [Planctomycetaceae bacterium]